MLSSDDLNVSQLLQKTKQLIVRSAETIRHCRETLKVSRQLQADRERNKASAELKAALSLKS